MYECPIPECMNELFLPHLFKGSADEKMDFWPEPIFLKSWVFSQTDGEK